MKKIKIEIDIPETLICIKCGKTIDVMGYLARKNEQKNDMCLRCTINKIKSESTKIGKIKIKCTCGKEFETYNRIFESPYDYMCPECNKKDAWRYATRMLKLEKFRCVKCSWKLKEKDCTAIEENELRFKCKCCGYEFGLWFPDPCDPYY